MGFSDITLGDLIGYGLTFFFGIAAGVSGDRYISKKNKTINQNNNTVTGGDIIGGNKNGNSKK